MTISAYDGNIPSIAKTFKDLTENKSARFHFTNGIYAGPAEKVVPTTLAGFKFLADKVTAPSDRFAIAVNSDESMKLIMDAKKASSAERDALEDQDTRAMKVLKPLSILFPYRAIHGIFYDEATPTLLYDELAAQDVAIETLYKFGFGTDPNAPKIEGAHNFKQVIAFPFPNDDKPICHDITVREDQSSFVKVIDLTKEIGPHGAPYLSKSGKVLFSVPTVLEKYAEIPPAPSGPAFIRG